MPEICAYEAERNARIARNNQKMVELGLPELALDFYRSVQRQRMSSKKRRIADRVPKVRPQLEKRRSSRLQLLPAPTYNEAVLDKIDAMGSLRQEVSGAVETYTEEHIKLLGDSKQEWTLFVDGYDANGERIYDKINGQTCHQCRQKTAGLRTSCSSCQSLKGVFCGDCLYMRYGENILEANANPSWVCPPCRGICNCSIHRIRQGLAPTGSQYRQAVAAGFKSVAHMVILQNQAPAQEAQPLKQSPEAKAPAADPEAVARKPKKASKENAVLVTRVTRSQQMIDSILPQRRQTRASKAAEKGQERPALRTVGLQQLRK